MSAEIFTDGYSVTNLNDPSIMAVQFALAILLFVTYYVIFLTFNTTPTVCPTEFNKFKVLSSTANKSNVNRPARMNHYNSAPKKQSPMPPPKILVTNPNNSVSSLPQTMGGKSNSKFSKFNDNGVGSRKTQRNGKKDKWANKRRSRKPHHKIPTDAMDLTVNNREYNDNNVDDNFEDDLSMQNVTSTTDPSHQQSMTVPEPITPRSTTPMSSSNSTEANDHDFKIVINNKKRKKRRKKNKKNRMSLGKVEDVSRSQSITSDTSSRSNKSSKERNHNNQNQKSKKSAPQKLHPCLMPLLSSSSGSSSSNHVPNEHNNNNNTHKRKKKYDNQQNQGNAHKHQNRRDRRRKSQQLNTIDLSNNNNGTGGTGYITYEVPQNQNQKHFKKLNAKNVSTMAGKYNNNQNSNMKIMPKTPPPMSNRIVNNNNNINNVSIKWRAKKNPSKPPMPRVGSYGSSLGSSAGSSNKPSELGSSHLSQTDSSANTNNTVITSTNTTSISIREIQSNPMNNNKVNQTQSDVSVVTAKQLKNANNADLNEEEKKENNENHDGFVMVEKQAIGIENEATEIRENLAIIDDDPNDNDVDDVHRLISPAEASVQKDDGNIDNIDDDDVVVVNDVNESSNNNSSVSSDSEHLQKFHDLRHEVFAQHQQQFWVPKEEDQKLDPKAPAYVPETIANGNLIQLLPFYNPITNNELIIPTTPIKLGPVPEATEEDANGNTTGDHSTSCTPQSVSSLSGNSICNNNNVTATATATPHNGTGYITYELYNENGTFIQPTNQLHTPANLKRNNVNINVINTTPQTPVQVQQTQILNNQILNTLLQLQPNLQNLQPILQSTTSTPSNIVNFGTEGQLTRGLERSQSLPNLMDALGINPPPHPSSFAANQSSSNLINPAIVNATNQQQNVNVNMASATANPNNNILANPFVQSILNNSMNNNVLSHANPNIVNQQNVNVHAAIAQALQVNQNNKNPPTQQAVPTVNFGLHPTPTLLNVAANVLPGVEAGLYWYHPQMDQSAVLLPVVISNDPNNPNIQGFVHRNAQLPNN